MPAHWLRQIDSLRKNDVIRSRLTLWITGIFIALLPFQWDFPPISLMIMILGVAVLFFFNRQSLRNIFSNRWLWPLAAYFLWMIVGAGYSQYPGEAEADIMLSISLLAWPLGLSALGGLERIQIQALFKVFVRALAVSVILCLILAFDRWLADGSGHHFFYKHLAVWERVPSHYLGLYLSFGILLCVNWFLRDLIKLRRWQKAEIAFTILLFLVVQVLLSVRIQFIALPLSLIPLIFAVRKSGSLSKKRINISLITAGLLFIAFLALPSTQRRLVETWHEIRSFNGVVDQKQTNARVFIWQYSADVIVEHVFWGTGTGGGNKALHEKLLHCDAQFWDGEKTYYLHEVEYNAHNQFLQSWMTHGLIGFLLLCAILFSPLLRCILQKDWLTPGFLILCIVAYSTEAMWERQAGVLWFAVFYALLVVVPQRKDITAT